MKNIIKNVAKTLGILAVGSLVGFLVSRFFKFGRIS
jgi:hypothetical protein